MVHGGLFENVVYYQKLNTVVSQQSKSTHAARLRQEFIYTSLFPRKLPQKFYTNIVLQYPLKVSVPQNTCRHFNVTEQIVPSGCYYIVVHHGIKLPLANQIDPGESFRHLIQLTEILSPLLYFISKWEKPLYMENTPHSISKGQGVYNCHWQIRWGRNFYQNSAFTKAGSNLSIFLPRPKGF